MKILVISDTHGHIDRAIKLLPILTELNCIVHLGDYLHDAENLKAYTDVPVIAVGGNCDGITSKIEGILTLSTPYGPILITHGHLHGAKKGVDRLLYQGEECGAKAVLFGHTHNPYYEVINNITLINPGSLSQPDNGRQGTYAILNIDSSGINCAIVNYQDPPVQVPAPNTVSAEPSSMETTSGEGTEEPQKNPPEKKHPGGFLRNLMNHSDRF